MRILFVCNWNQNRSRTAEEVFAGAHETASAGLYGGTIITRDHLDWAELVAVMDETMHAELRERFPSLDKPVVNLEVPNNYSYRQPELVELLRSKARLLGED